MRSAARWAASSRPWPSPRTTRNTRTSPAAVNSSSSDTVPSMRALRASSVYSGVGLKTIRPADRWASSLPRKAGRAHSPADRTPPSAPRRLCGPTRRGRLAAESTCLDGAGSVCGAARRGRRTSESAGRDGSCGLARSRAVCPLEEAGLRRTLDHGPFDGPFERGGRRGHERCRGRRDQLGDDWRDRKRLWHFRSCEFAHWPRRSRKARRHDRGRR